MTRPIQQNIYTMAEIDNQLTLRDSPFLRVHCGEGMERVAIQTSHMEVRLSELSPEWAESKWRYIRETDEWIPLFTFAGTLEEQAALVDAYEVPVEKRLFKDEREFMVTPKGHPWNE